MTSLEVEVDGKASSAAVSALSTRVTTNEGDITSVSGDLTVLEAEVDDKAESTAVAALEVRVETNEDGISAQAIDITALEVEVDGKASSAAVGALTTRVTTAEDDIDAVSSDVTLLEAEVDDKAEAAAVTALTTRVTTTEDEIEAVADDLTALEAEVDGIATSTALTELSARVTVNEGDIDGVEADVATKAEASSVTALSTRVTTAEGDIGDAEDDIVVEASAREALETRVDLIAKTVDYNSIATTAAGVNADGEYAFLTGTNPTTASTTRTHTGIQSAAAILFYEEDANTDQGTFLDAVESGDIIRFDYSSSIWYEFEVTGSVAAAGARRVVPVEHLRSGNPSSTTLATSTRDVQFTFNRVQGALSRWTVKVRVGDLAGGIGLLNDGGEVSMVVAADRFVMLPASGSLADKVTPFAVVGGVVYIRSAVIENATIGGVKLESGILGDLTAAHGKLGTANIGSLDVFDVAVGNQIVSDDFVAGVDGYRLNRDGVQFNDGVQGDLRSTNFTAGANGLGWRLQANGSAELQAASIRGALSASIITAGTMSADRISGGSISASIITSGTMSANRISGGSISASLITTGSMSASRITSGTMSANRISGGSIDAGLITTGSLSASIITSGTMSADRISGGTISASLITVGSLSASRIAGGTLNAGNITVTGLSASAITTGTMSANRISGGSIRRGADHWIAGCLSDNGSSVREHQMSANVAISTGTECNGSTSLDARVFHQPFGTCCQLQERAFLSRTGTLTATGFTGVVHRDQMRCGEHCNWNVRLTRGSCRVLR